MGRYTKEDILRMAEENDVAFVRLQFTDILGTLKNVAITVSQLERALDNKCMVDGSSIEGFVRIEESDMYLYPDYNSFEIFPWDSKHGKIARLICDVHLSDGTPFSGDPRNVLKRAIEKAEKMGYTFKVGPECEFFLFQTDEEGNPTTIANDKGGYFDLGPIDLGESCRRDICLALEEMGFEIEASHHEVAEGQHEIDFKYDDALKTADNVMTFKYVVKIMAQQHKLHATFMPKPIYGIAGSGMHTNMSLFKDGKNVFCDESGPYGLSETALHFIAGIMEHIKSITAIANPIVNSYKRLVPGYEAPVYIAWSLSNRSALIRVPAKRGNATRIELRSPDGSCNPYLVMAVLLTVAMEGVKNQVKPPLQTEENIYEMSARERKRSHIDSLPGSLNEALALMKKSKIVRQALGEHIFNEFVMAKEIEWDRYRTDVSPWETKEYLEKY